MRIDWQAYLDGSLSPEAAALAERELIENPSARKELEGLKSFCSCVRNACLAEEVPLDRLNSLMPPSQVAQAMPRAPRRQWLYGLAAAAVFILVMLRVTSQGPTALPDELATSDPVAAAQWASSRFSMSVPALDLGPDAPLVFAHGHGSRCCFDYSVNGGTYHVNFERRSGPVGNGRKITLATGQTAYMGRGVRWVQGDYELYVIGPNVDVSKKVADRTSEKLQRI